MGRNCGQKNRTPPHAVGNSVVSKFGQCRNFPVRGSDTVDQAESSVEKSSKGRIFFQCAALINIETENIDQIITRIPFQIFIPAAEFISIESI